MFSIVNFSYTTLFFSETFVITAWFCDDWHICIHSDEIDHANCFLKHPEQTDLFRLTVQRAGTNSPEPTVIEIVEERWWFSCNKTAALRGF